MLNVATTVRRQIIVIKLREHALVVVNLVGMVINVLKVVQPTAKKVNVISMGSVRLVALINDTVRNVTHCVLTA